MNKLKQRLLLLALATATAVFADDDGFGFDDLEALEAGEQQTLLQMAKEAANNYDFSKAQSLIEQAQNKAYAPDDVESAKQALASAKDRKKRELATQQQQQQQQQSSGSGSVYVVDWGTDFQSGNSIWGRNNVKLNNGKKVYMWLYKNTSGFKCYQMLVQGSFYASASFCGDSIESYSSWQASCGSGQFQVQGNHADVAKKLISRCGG